MSLHFLLDGYNIIHQMPLLKLQKAEEERKRLVRFIERFRPQGSLSNQVTIVFDGYSNLGAGSSSDGVRVIYSQGQSADEKIKDLVAQSANKKNLVVVTNDREIQYAVRACGAKICRVDEFLGKVSMKVRAENRKKGSQGKDSTKEISHTLEYKITSEFENIWLKKENEKS